MIVFYTHYEHSMIAVTFVVEEGENVVLHFRITDFMGLERLHNIN